MLDRHLYLIGMPGSGKSSLGRRAARETGLSFADLDEGIEQITGLSIPEIFAAHGEEAFRRAETRLLAEWTRHRPMLISTGGGTVMNPVNRKIMRCWGTILLLDRPLENILGDIRMENRPLLRDDGPEKLRELYDQRMPVYREAADLVICNSAEYDQTLRAMVRLLRDKYGV